MVLFASQGHRVVHQIVSVVRVAAPLVVYFAVVFFGTLIVAGKMGFGYQLAVTQSFTAASNNFELAIAGELTFFLSFFFESIFGAQKAKFSAREVC